MIPVYNCARFLPEALQSVLQQAVPGQQMQIEVVDDASTDADVEAIVNSIGKGRVRYFRQESNVGSLRNFETCINRARGQLIHILHGDDRVKAGYYAKMEELFRRYPEAGAAFCRYNYIDDAGEKMYHQRPEMPRDGILPDWLLRIAEYQRIQYAAITVRREVYERLGAFYGVTYGEDWEMWVRIAKHYPVAYTPAVLAEYRKHFASISGQKFLVGQYLDDLILVMKHIQQYLPEKERERVLRKSKKFYAFYSIRQVNTLWHAHQNKDSLRVQITRALNLYRDHYLYWKVLKIKVKMLINRR